MAGALLALLGGALAWAAGGGEEAGPAGADEAAARSVTVAGGELKLSYPETLVLAAGEGELTDGAALGCGEGFELCFYLPEEAYAGSNLAAAALRVSAREELTAEVSCLLAQPAGRSDLRPGLERGERVSTARFGDLSEGAAGSFARGDVLRLWTGERCFELEKRLVLTRPENYEPGTVTEFTEEEQAELLAGFDEVLDSAMLADGSSVTWPSAPRSTLEAFVSVASPLSGASVTSPLTITGEAVGPWFFEATFPVELVTEDGEVLASGFLIADGHWMTTDFVPFSGELEFEVEQATEARLVLKRDNPSDLRENDASTWVPVVLLPAE